jgi:hypothetical protein
MAVKPGNCRKKENIFGNFRNKYLKVDTWIVRERIGCGE